MTLFQARHVDLHLRATDIRAVECDRKADAGVQQQIVVRDIASSGRLKYAASIAHAAEQRLRDPRLVEVATGRWNRQSDDSHRSTVERHRARKQQIFEGGRLEGSIDDALRRVHGPATTTRQQAAG